MSKDYVPWTRRPGGAGGGEGTEDVAGSGWFGGARSSDDYVEGLVLETRPAREIATLDRPSGGRIILASTNRLVGAATSARSGRRHDHLYPRSLRRPHLSVADGSVVPTGRLVNDEHYESSFQNRRASPPPLLDIQSRAT